jgi:hypothetical protein
METNSTQQAARREKEWKEKMMGNKATLIAGCPESRPFWTDHCKDLKCFACNFSQKWNKSHEHCLRDDPLGMTK